MIIGIDAGNNAIKIYGERGSLKFSSAVGEYRDRRLKSTFGSDDMIVKFDDTLYFAGTLAEFESEFSTSLSNDTKANDDLLIRVLLALHRYSKNDELEFQIVVGQPISTHTDEEKNKMKNSLIGTHEITINDVKKKMTIKDVVIAAEGGAAYWSNPQKGVTRILDFGSSTVNGATLNEGRYIDRDSFTVPQGLNTITSNDLNSFARKIAVYASRKWNNDDVIQICGGGSDLMIDKIRNYFPNAVIMIPRYGDNSLDPVFANAIGFYAIGKKLFNQ